VYFIKIKNVHNSEAGLVFFVSFAQYYMFPKQQTKLMKSVERKKCGIFRSNEFFLKLVRM
jgi:hypothetical protein